MCGDRFVVGATYCTPKLWPVLWSPSARVMVTDCKPTWATVGVQLTTGNRC
jgi:hypothetical protein